MKANNRRKTLLAGLMMLISSAAAEPEPVVATKAGYVRGTTLKSLLGNEFFSFKGIPYAEPPLGDLRFRLPEPHDGWSGVRDASSHGNKCPQADMFTAAPVGHEDCLFVNVYTPRLPTELEDVRLPVMVYIHGGGFVLGDGDAAPLIGPDYLLDQQVVLVTLNYRLGVFGFLTTGDEVAPGNYGLHDQTMALRWVQDNIAAFGGDPDEVTIFGESAGGASVGLQVLSPLSRGLFARAISQSGSAFCNFAANGVPQGELAKQHAELLGCESGSSQAIVECLRQKSTEDIMQVVPQLNAPAALITLAIPYKPRVDAEADVPFLPEDPYLALQKGRFNRVPWLNGINHDEGAGNVGMLLAMAPAMLATQDWNVLANTVMDLSKAADDPPSMAERVYRYYFGEDTVSEANIDRMVDLLSDRTFTACQAAEIELASAHTAVYKYILNHTGPGRQRLVDMFDSVLGVSLENVPDLGVSHADDLMYLFKTAGAPAVALDSDKHRVIRFMVSVWTSFARHGYPSSDVLAMPRWPRYTADEQQHMWLNTEPSVGRAAFSERIQFWRELDIKENWRGPLDTLQKDEL